MSEKQLPEPPPEPPPEPDPDPAYEPLPTRDIEEGDYGPKPQTADD